MLTPRSFLSRSSRPLRVAVVSSAVAVLVLVSGVGVEAKPAWWSAAARSILDEAAPTARTVGGKAASRGKASRGKSRTARSAGQKGKRLAQRRAARRRALARAATRSATKVASAPRAAGSLRRPR